mgnify:CR=1 FL=1
MPAAAIGWSSTDPGVVAVSGSDLFEPFDGDKTLWASFVIEDRDIKVFFSGDSGYFDGFKEIGRKFGPFDLTMVETGAYDRDGGSAGDAMRSILADAERLSSVRSGRVHR